ncbi:hypothetical protein B0I37DRAFT_411617 [Chaetomium sp. MPI-CAGE-AT-0009]|nr:hypothetical protein B0I37DRAFT_411617 [Chaetomium sp. MPI-CAGE-AT-0009]
MVSLRSLIASAALIAAPVMAAFTPTNLSDFIKSMTEQSIDLQDVAQNITTANARSTVPQFIEQFKHIVDATSTFTIGELEALVTKPIIPREADAARASDFVQANQKLFDILISKAGIFQKYPSRGRRLSAAFRAFKTFFKPFAMYVTHTAQPKAWELEAEAKSLDATLDRSIQKYEDLQAKKRAEMIRTTLKAVQEAMSGLSSNWKNLQAKIKAESASQPAALKRKASDIGDSFGPQPSAAKPPPRKKQKKQKQNQKQKPALPSKPLTKTLLLKTPKPPMGNTQSSKIDPIPPQHGVAPSLAVWAADNGISSESIAEAYGLGIQSNSLLSTDNPDRPNEGLAPGVEVGKYVGIDCEMVGIGEGGHDDSLARVSVVDFLGQQVYDSFVKQREPVVKWRTRVSGVGPQHMATARTFDEVQAQIARLLKGRVLVGHDVQHDLRVLELDHPRKMIRDTAKFSGFKKYAYGRRPALRVLAQELLGVEIQAGQHSSIEDARVTMLLFRKHKPAFDVEHANRYPDKAKPKPKAGKGKKAKKTKKR